MLFKINSKIRFLRSLCVSNFQSKCKAISSIPPEVSSLYEGLIENKRNCLSKAITLIETTNLEKKKKSQILLNLIMGNLRERRKKNLKSSLRIGFTGPPGAGKSSLIEIFGKYIIKQLGLKVAVLTVDPSSATTGGSILGDKIRMPELSVDPSAFIRSSPNKCTLGGVTRTTLETIFVCEAGNFDIILVETVGVGQAEHNVMNMVDCVVLLIPPGSGDELQGLKKGIVELADIVAITKFDNNLKPEAQRVKREYTSASKYIRIKNKFWKPKVILTSSHENLGIENLWNLLDSYKQKMLENDRFYTNRENQLKSWFWSHLEENLFKLLFEKSTIKKELEHLEMKVTTGQMTPGEASDVLINKAFTSLRRRNI